MSICRRRSIGAAAVAANGSAPSSSPPLPGASSPRRRPVRMLLIDNYDSYTYNLFQLMSMVNGGKKEKREELSNCFRSPRQTTSTSTTTLNLLSHLSFSPLHHSTSQRNPTSSTTTRCPGRSCALASWRESGTASSSPRGRGRPWARTTSASARRCSPRPLLLAPLLLLPLLASPRSWASAWGCRPWRTPAAD